MSSWRKELWGWALMNWFWTMISGTMVRGVSCGIGTSADILLADIIAAILPENDMQEIPQGFTQVGHVCKLPAAFD